MFAGHWLALLMSVVIPLDGSAGVALPHNVAAWDANRAISRPAHSINALAAKPASNESCGHKANLSGLRIGDRYALQFVVFEWHVMIPP